MAPPASRSNTSYIESASGVGEGARTGLASVVTGVLFLLATIFAPLVAIIPNEAAVPALVLVGFLMMQQVKHIAWDDIEIALPAFLTIVLMPFTYSISVGIGAGFLAYVLIKLVRGKAAAGAPADVGGLGAVRRLLRHRPDQAAARRLTACDARTAWVRAGRRRRVANRSTTKEPHMSTSPQEPLKDEDIETTGQPRWRDPRPARRR